MTWIKLWWILFGAILFGVSFSHLFNEGDKIIMFGCAGLGGACWALAAYLKGQNDDIY